MSTTDTTCFYTCSYCDKPALWWVWLEKCCDLYSYACNECASKAVENGVNGYKVVCIKSMEIEMSDVHAQTTLYTLNCSGELTGDKETEALVANTLVEFYELWCHKYKSYGKHNIGKFGALGVLVRASDKLERLTQLLNKGIDDPLVDESINDTWRDLSIYALIGYLVQQGKWPT